MAGEASATINQPGGAPPLKVKAYEKGDYFGELALLSDNKRAANVVAESEVTCLLISRLDFQKLTVRAASTLSDELLLVAGRAVSFHFDPVAVAVLTCMDRCALPICQQGSRVSIAPAHAVCLPCPAVALCHCSLRNVHG